MDICYVVGPEGIGNEARSLPTRMLWRQEALSLSQAGAMRRIALQEVLSLLRFGVASHLRIPHEDHLKDAVTRAVVCAEAMAVGVPVTIGNELITAGREPNDLRAFAYEASRERHRLLPSAASAEGGLAYISPGWPSKIECARLAHKLVYEMEYSRADVARIFEIVDIYERPTMWTRQGISRMLLKYCDGEECLCYREESGTMSRRAGRLHLPGSCINAMAALGDERAGTAAQSLDAAAVPVPVDHLASLLASIVDYGSLRTLYVTGPDTVFSTPTQRRVVYDLALFRDVQVVEDGFPITAVDDNPRYRRLLREGTELFVALRVRDHATIVEESRSIVHAQETAAELHSQGFSLREIAARLNEEAIPTVSGKGAWGPGKIGELLSSGREADR